MSLPEFLELPAGTAFVDVNGNPAQTQTPQTVRVTGKDGDEYTFQPPRAPNSICRVKAADVTARRQQSMEEQMTAEIWAARGYDTGHAEIVTSDLPPLGRDLVQNLQKAGRHDVAAQVATQARGGK
jgi:hypothetical protein